MALETQIKSLVNDAYADAVGKNSTIKQQNPTNLVDMGKNLAGITDGYEAFYGSMVNRITQTKIFIRTYKGKRRNVLRDEKQYGAFTQKIYYIDSLDAVDNPVYKVAQGTTPQTYAQHSPYDVTATVPVQSLLYGTKGTWSLEIIRPISQIKSAFLNEASMMAFIDGIYIYIENKLEKQIEAITSTAVNTSIANSVNHSKIRYLLDEYNTAHTGATLTVAQALESADFLKFASKEIGETIEHMNNMTGTYNIQAYPIASSREQLVVEMLSHFAKATDMYLQADTFHNELTALPNFEKVSFWQWCGQDNFKFADCAKISLKGDILKTSTNLTGEVVVNNVICFIHDIENVASYFGERRTWEELNKRDNVIVHGEQAVTGFSIDNYANAFVFALSATLV